jgi:ferredoxin
MTHPILVTGAAGRVGGVGGLVVEALQRRGLPVRAMVRREDERAGLTVSWDSKFQSLLELAEACDVPVRWSCRAGVCHTCECGLTSGSVKYDPEPLEPAAAGNLLICCSRPQEDVVIDISREIPI